MICDRVIESFKLSSNFYIHLGCSIYANVTHFAKKAISVLFI